MEKSETQFNIFENKDPNDQGVGASETPGNVNIIVDVNDKGLLAHELKHGFQLLKGKNSFTRLENNKSVVGVLYDLWDYVEAFRVQWAIEYYDKNFD